MTEYDDYAWVPVFRALDLVQARIVAARLDDQGIPVTIQEESASSVMPVGVGLLAEINVLTPDEFYDRALMILRDLDLLDEGPS